MVTNELIMYLEDKKISMDKKRQLLIKLNLNYSDLLMLMEMYNDNSEMHRILYKEFSYYSNVYKNKIKKPKKVKVKKFKMTRRIEND